ncbi:MAG: methylenetetrahydrofolate--tRNA-(uracil(54)-C(5))-methyltransferase (FADH(2)-oxidizing) TrmFO [Anaerolineales bacterium]|nr:MAG: methylenetetrahydrofolate--tRNA-(uracil(54)-C(5))-methyltransferase (FADH(2)-oxidizing) TrmFO [Anaerolineales bacterium]
MNEIVIVGGGLAGSEAAWQAAQRGVPVTLFEMRPGVMTPAHTTHLLAELVCSNSLGSDLPDRAPGLLKAELRHLGSLILRCADENAVPAGGALAVGREAFARAVTVAVASHPLISLKRKEIDRIPDQGMVVLATGPLTSESLAEDIVHLTGEDQLFFYDAMAPIVTLESIDMSRAFRASRYGRGGADYINCPMSREEYDRFVDQLLRAETRALRDFERRDKRFFEACLPVEVTAQRGRETLAFGPLKPVGLVDPHTGRQPYAVVQLRQDNISGTLYNLVGFQTNLKWSEQRRVFSLIPGLEHAEFVRYGQMHRNTFINSPGLLNATLECRRRGGLFFGGQITGTEGYIGSTCSGYVAGLNAARLASGLALLTFPRVTMIGALCHYVSSAEGGHFQPMKPNFGLLPPLAGPRRRKRARYRAYAARALAALQDFAAGLVLVEDGEPRESIRPANGPLSR